MMSFMQEPDVLHPQGHLHSGPSLKPSFVRFLNRTQRRVDVIWINYEGLRVRYKTLGPYEFFDVNTFVNHPWIFRDSDTRDKMVVCSKEVFHPDPWDKGLPQDAPHSPQRKLVCITLPVYTLKERCFQVIRYCIRTKDAASSLDIPTSLKKEFFAFVENTCR